MVSNDIISDLAKTLSIKANQTLSLQTEEPVVSKVKDVEDQWEKVNKEYKEKKDVPADHIKVGNELAWVSSYLKAKKALSRNRIDSLVQGAVFQGALAGKEGFLVTAYNQLGKELYL